MIDNIRCECVKLKHEEKLKNMLLRIVRVLLYTHESKGNINNYMYYGV